MRVFQHPSVKTDNARIAEHVTSVNSVNFTKCYIIWQHVLFSSVYSFLQILLLCYESKYFVLLLSFTDFEKHAFPIDSLLYIR